MEHFRNPRNFGSIANPDGVGKVGQPICGDVMHMYIKVADGKIVDIKFETFGCAAAIATSSMMTELAKGKTLKQALGITHSDVSNALGCLPPIKEHCSNLAADALAEAIYDYMTKNKTAVPQTLQERHKQITLHEHR